MAFRLPSFICSRQFSPLKIESESRKLMKPAEVTEDTVREVVVTHRSDLEMYNARHELELPASATLKKIDAVCKIPLWQLILRPVEIQASNIEDALPHLSKAWQVFLRQLSW